MKPAVKVLILISVGCGLQACSWQAPSPPPQSIAVAWDAPNFQTLLEAIKTCQHPDLEEDTDCADRGSEVREALQAVEFCLHTPLRLHACRAIERKLVSQRAPLFDAGRMLNAFGSAGQVQLRSYFPITNKWLGAEWRWKDRGTLIRHDNTGFAMAAFALALAVSGLARAAGQLSVIRFRSRSQRVQDCIERARQEAIEQVEIKQSQERRWLVLLHQQFLDAGIDRLPFEERAQTPFAELWTAGLGTEYCGQHDVTINDCHRPTGVRLVVTSVPPRPDIEGWRFHVYFGEVQDAVRCERPDSLLADPSKPDWSEYRTFREIPMDRADVALAVARRLLFRAMRGTELLNQRGTAVPKSWQPYPEEVPLYLAASVSIAAVDT